MAGDSESLKWSLRQFGYSDSAISAAWPAWWSAEASPSAQAELRFSVARKLGLDARQLIEDDAPTFVWKDAARFKRLTTESADERAAIGSYGISVARLLVSALPSAGSSPGLGSAALRTAILASQRFVTLLDLLSACWAFGIPVIHLRVFPLPAKRMCAMAVRVAGRTAILLGKDSKYPAPIAYYLAHELGHIALGHLKTDAGALVDLADPLTGTPDEEELAADRYALELLTGQPEPTVSTETQNFTADQLANVLLITAPQVRIEPGTLALCFGHSTVDWPRAYAAMGAIYPDARPVWVEVNRIALQQLNWAALSDDLQSFLRTAMGERNDERRD